MQYFVLQREIGFSKWNLKIGHAKNPKTRFYSYRGIYNEAYLIHTIPVCSKKLACELERGFLRILKGQFKKEELFYDVREWVPFNDSIKPILKKWGVAHEMV